MITPTKVTDSIWRGPRPTNFAEFKGFFKSVISLEGLAEDGKEALDIEPKIRLYSYPISSLQIAVPWLAISEEYLDEIYKTMVFCDKPLLVHCREGRDRTGLAIATYRVRAQNWPKQKAMQEARDFGYRWWWDFGLTKTFNKYA